MNTIAAYIGLLGFLVVIVLCIGAALLLWREMRGHNKRGDDK